MEAECAGVSRVAGALLRTLLAPLILVLLLVGRAGLGCMKGVKSHFMLFIGLGSLPATPRGLVLKVSSAATLGLPKSIEDVIRDTVCLHFSSSKLVYIH